MRVGLVRILLVGVAAGVCPAGETIEPTGIYFNAFTGPFSGTEWFQVVPIAGTNRYRMADIFSGGFNCTITPEGEITLDGGVGDGSFSDADNFVVTPFLGGTFTFDNNRAPFTTSAFPLEMQSPVAGNELLEGTYRSLTQQINPVTGAVIGGGFETVTILVNGGTFRITDPQGLFFQGVFETPVQSVFRVVVPTPSDPRFRTIPGSSINFTQNMLGEARIETVNRWTATVLLQSRTPLGQQTQLLFRFTADRVVPLRSGDLDGDDDVDEQDRSLLLAQLGFAAVDDAFNVAADLNDDEMVDMADLLALNAILPVSGDCDADGDTDVADVAAFDACNVGPGTLRSTDCLCFDFDGDGDVDFADFAGIQRRVGE